MIPPDLGERDTWLFATDAGVMEVIVDRPPTAWVGAAIVAHPQPRMGGNARHKLPQFLARSLAEAGWLVLRPNFRGVGASKGQHDEGRGESEDLLALATALQDDGRFSKLALVGFSFGAFVQARVAHDLARMGRPAWRVFLAGMPFGDVQAGQRYDTPDEFPDARIVHGEADGRVPTSAILDWARPRIHPIVLVPGADHFFTGKLTVLRSLLLEHFQS